LSWNAHSLIQGQLYAASTALLCLTSARVVNKDVANHLRGYRKKMCATLPLDVVFADQPKEGFVNESRALKRMLRPLTAEVPIRQAPQFRVDQRSQFF
jgi:hypothetical protein